MALPDSPLTRGEQYLSAIAGEETALPNVPLTRTEQYLAKIAGQDVAIPNVPLTRQEQYLAYIAENGGGGSDVDPYEIARQILRRTITEYIDDGLTSLGHSAFRKCTSLTTLRAHNVTSVSASCIEETGITSLALPKLTSISASAYGSCNALRKLDYGPGVSGLGPSALPFAGLKVLILRRSASLVAGTTSSLNGTPMKSGGSGCTVYIPKVLYDHLGDGTSLDYKAAQYWSTFDGYGTITWAQIEGSEYEHYYADGTPIE